MELHPLKAFGIQAGELISLVGAGGKTTLMYNLAKELIHHFGYIITSTTTKIRRPTPAESPHIFLLSPEEKVDHRVKMALETHRYITIASKPLPDNKLKGLKPATIEKLRQLHPEMTIIIEADGAAQKSLKAPADWEPVIPEETTLLIPVVGLDALGKDLTEEHVFRSKVAAKLLGLRPKSVITEEHIASLLTHPRGIMKGSPTNARIIPFINKVELIKDLGQAKSLAEKILARHHPGIKRVILGNALSFHPVSLVINAP